MSKIGENYIGSPQQRLLDIATAALLGIVSVPLLSASAIALGYEQRDLHMLIRQQRVGKEGRLFGLWKLKTLKGNDHSDEFELGGSEHPLATPLASAIRKVGIDETPQCLNVLLGDIHMVGIRSQLPIVLEQRENADPILFKEWQHWAEINPGVVGLGEQLAHRHKGPYSESSPVAKAIMRVDIESSENASFRSDVACLASTPLDLIRNAVSAIRSAREETAGIPLAD